MTSEVHRVSISNEVPGQLKRNEDLKAKRQAEEAISRIISKLQEKTGLRAQSINIVENLYAKDSAYPLFLTIKIELKL